MPQQCASCSHSSPDGAKFCLECGTPFARVCTACGLPTGGGKFCMECGTPVAGSGAPAAPAPVTAAASVPVSERRTTTVLFGDLVAFTTLSETRDPEEVRELLSAYFAVARTVVGRYGGTIEKFIGDAVMAVWGVPVSHEDDAERAVRAGLDLVEEVAALGVEVGAPGLSMRVGIVTGSVAVTLGAVNEGMVAGDAVNTAARVQTAAAPGTVWVDQETRGLTAAAVAFSDMGEHALKGKAEPARLFRADAVVAAVGGAQRVDGLEAPMTGRDAAMRQVKELFHATQGDGRARIAVVTALPGVGKSRLGWEFEKYSDGLSTAVRWHRGRCLSYGDGVAFWAFAEMVRSRLGLLEGDEPGEVAAKVHAGVAAVATDASEAAWLEPRLAVLLGVGEKAGFARSDLFAAWTTFVDRVGGQEQVVLLFEDVQHADTALLELVEHLLETSRSKLFVMVLARPELLEQRPSLVAGRRATVIGLDPLTDEQMTTLVDGLVHDLPARARTALVARAEGIPLYAVETVRSLIDRDAVVASEGRYVFVDHDHTRVDLDQLAAPVSLQTLIAARLDTLTALERRTVQDASVLGLAFRQSGLMALSDVSGYELDAALAGLVRKGVIETEDDPRSPERGQYRFLQALVREVAYSTLARKDRRTRHLAVAAHLEGDDPAEALAGVIAQHLLDALAASGDHDAERPLLTERARTLLVAAAERAESLGSPAEAMRSTLAALDLDPDPLMAAQLQERAARTGMGAGDLTRAEALAAAAAAAYRSLGHPVDAARTVAVGGRVLQSLGRTQDAGDLCRAGLELLAERPDADPGIRIALLGVLTAVARAAGDRQTQVTLSIEQLSLAEVLGDPAAQVASLNNLALALVDHGCSVAYVALLERGVVLAREHRLLEALTRSLSNLCAETYAIDLARAGEQARETLDAAQQAGAAHITEIAMVNVGFAWWLAGRWDEASAELTAWLDGRESTGSTAGQQLIQVQMAIARGASIPHVGDLPDSDDAWEQMSKVVTLAVATAQQPGGAAGAAVAAREAALDVYGAGDYVDDFEMYWAPAVELQLAVGDLDAAEQVLALAEPHLRRKLRPLLAGEAPRLRGMVTAARGGDPERDLREAERAHAAYGAPYLLARTRHELARWLVGQHRAAEAALLAAQARDAYLSLGAAPMLADLDVLVPSPVPVAAAG